MYVYMRIARNLSPDKGFIQVMALEEVSSRSFHDFHASGSDSWEIIFEKCKSILCHSVNKLTVFILGLASQTKTSLTRSLRKNLISDNLFWYTTLSPDQFKNRLSCINWVERNKLATNASFLWLEWLKALVAFFPKAVSLLYFRAAY